MRRLITGIIVCALTLGASSAAAGPIVVTLSGVLSGNSPFGASGSEFSFSFELDDTTRPVSSNAAGTSASYSSAVTSISFTSANATLFGPPTNSAADSNLILVFDNAGQTGTGNEDLVQAFFDLPDQGSFTDLFFGFLLLDRHADGEPAPNSITTLGLDLFAMLDPADFVRDFDGTQIANNQFVFRGFFNGTRFSDFDSTITSISATPGAMSVPEPASTLLLAGLMIALIRRLKSSSISRVVRATGKKVFA